ncbi:MULTISPECIES: RepB family plasmid replication initiator protein [Pseudomonas]|uniref:RepB family plasmid replication initiator protein n=1 Tax=Pseudomonas TaxID=286 RepID=UPI001F3A0ABD|nr:RepB family plasmid replication initiator protein [Pseudomonas juntendi]MCO7054505.1 RepB family plasmid replication initiator protein [Pseudomonas juntendi]UJM12391.1 RepB family plasmid replication initiator protein [Pseudomonas juntendi]UXA38625.1 RepB family plasmid replication initiator protein [Pseudomonas juntendi]
MKYILKENGKEKEVFKLKGYVSVPRIFLALPLFNTINAHKEPRGFEIAKNHNAKNIHIASTSLTIFNDFEVFLFILRKVYSSKSNEFEFTLDEIMNDFDVKTSHRTMYFSIFKKSIRKLNKINIEYEEETEEGTKTVFLNFITGELTKKGGKIEVSKRFIEFFGSLKELYEIDTKMLSLLTNEYQRILYVLYVCNRRNKTNYFSVEMLKERFRISDKMPDKTFVMKIRKANESLKEMGLIEGFNEEKANRATTRFLVNYSYNSLYKDFKEKKEIAEKIKVSKAEKKAVKKLNLDAFASDIDDKFKEEIERQNNTNNEVK